MYSLIISFCALGLTFYQAYLQRTHNKKSVKPLCQIDLGDRKKKIYIYVQNNGVGPMIINKMTFIKADRHYNKISDCLTLDSKSYWHLEISETNKKSVTPNSYTVIFEKNIEIDTNADIEDIKKQLASITVKISYQDIYGKQCRFEKSLQWFARYSTDDIYRDGLKQTH